MGQRRGQRRSPCLLARKRRRSQRRSPCLLARKRRRKWRKVQRRSDFQLNKARRSQARSSRARRGGRGGRCGSQARGPDGLKAKSRGMQKLIVARHYSAEQLRAYGRNVNSRPASSWQPPTRRPKKTLCPLRAPTQVLAARLSLRDCPWVFVFLIGLISDHNSLNRKK